MSAIIGLCANIARNPDRIDVEVEHDSDHLLAQVVAAREEWDALVNAVRVLTNQLEGFRAAATDARIWEKDDGDAIEMGRAVLQRVGGAVMMSHHDGYLRRMLSAIPEWERVNERRALLVPCSYCPAPAGEPCRNMKEFRRAHRDRIAKALSNDALARWSAGARCIGCGSPDCAGQCP